MPCQRALSRCLRRVACAGAGLLVLATAGAARAATITELPAGAPVTALASGPDGNLWFLAAGSLAVGRMTPSGTVTTFTAGISGDAGALNGIAAGPDGNVWFTEAAGRIGRITPDESVTEHSGATDPHDIVAGPDGNLWYTTSNLAIGQVTPSGSIAQVSPGPIFPGGIAAGPDGALWFPSYSTVSRVTTGGVVNDVATLSGPAHGIAAGADGNLWLTEDGGRIARVTPAGAVTELTDAIGGDGALAGIAAGPDGHLWFGAGARGIGRVTTGGTVTTFTAGLGAAPAVTAVTVGPDGQIWFADGSAIGRLALDRPAVATGAASRVANRAATVMGTINAYNDTTTYHLEYGTTALYGQRTPEAVAGATAADVTVATDLADLAPQTTYHYRVVATNAEGATPGADRTFTTAADPGGEVGGTGSRVDADGDGFAAGADCDDANAAIHPGATEVRGNAVDENCDGRADPYPSLDIAATLLWSVLGNGHTRIRALSVSGLAAGETVRVACTGAGCRKAAKRTVTIKSRKTATLSLTGAVRGMTLRAKAQLAITVSRKGYISRTIRYTMVGHANPRKATRCLAPGARKAVVC